MAAALFVVSLFLIGEADIRFVEVEGNSMSPTIADGQEVRMRPGQPSNRFDIVLYRFPLDESRAYVGRVIGLPGDLLEIRNGSVWINGRELAEPHLNEPIGYEATRLVVPPGEYYVLGDNRNDSSDSHVWGTVPADNMLGVVDLDVLD